MSLDQDPGDLVVEESGPTVGEVVRALSQLPFNQRAALVMREFEGRSLAEIAEQLRVTSSAVEALLFRARRGLGEQLEASLGCAEAEQAISRQLDRALPRSERGALRAHLRECPECASLARRMRAQRSTLKSLALVPVPVSLTWGRLAPGSAAGGASATAGASLASAGAVKVLAAAGVAALAISGGYAALGHHATRTPARADVPARGARSPVGTRPALAPGSALTASAPIEARRIVAEQTLVPSSRAVRPTKHAGRGLHISRAEPSGRGASGVPANAGRAASYAGPRRGAVAPARRAATPTRRSSSTGNVALRARGRKRPRGQGGR